ncbi:MAG: RNA polymerase subunit sigma-24 [Chlorobiaceae bacterium]|nr:RNA polymerase subunit sigma-24 [Chlorobiaceae bacterium]NTV17265.1 RNA polymerase subunit sigma-24 [Chlorobiaceae bacterium]
MNRIKKTALDLVDDIYSLAYWMTGSEEVSHDLVYCTYLSASSSSEERELLKKFRECYVTRFGQKTDFCTSKKTGKGNLQLVDSLMQWAADIKLSVLLSEISGLKHRQISEIVGKPVETVRLWLFWGRKLLSYTNPVHMGQLKAS